MFGISLHHVNNVEFQWKLNTVQLKYKAVVGVEIYDQRAVINWLRKLMFQKLRQFNIFLDTTDQRPNNYTFFPSAFSSNCLCGRQEVDVIQRTLFY